MSARWCLQAYLIYHCHKCVEVAYIGQDSLTVKVVARKRETVHSFIGNVLRVVLQPDDVEKEKIIAFQPNPACQSDDREYQCCRRALRDETSGCLLPSSES